MRHPIPVLAGTICIALAAGGAVFTPDARADPVNIPRATCSAGGLREPPKFTQTPPGRAQYSFEGLCVTYYGKLLSYRIDGTWTPTAGGNRANASEVVHARDLTGSNAYVAVIGWRCPVDPWLHDVECQRVGQDVPEGMRGLWTRFDEDLSFPVSSRKIPDADRRALILAYERANGRLGIDLQRVQAAEAIHTHVPDILGHADSVLPGADGIAPDAQSIPPHVSGTIARPADAVSLNPQPLPPRQRKSGAAALKGRSKATETGIIVVGGKTSLERTGAAPLRASVDGEVVKRAVDTSTSP